MTTPQRPIFIIRLNGLVEIEWWPDSLRLRFADGASMTSAPQDTDEYRALAKTLGYGEDAHACLQMAWEHDTLHCWLALLLGATSLAGTVPWQLAHGTMDSFPQWALDGQEALVLAFQRFLHTGYAGHELAVLPLVGIDLEDASVRFGTLIEGGRHDLIAP